MELIRKIRNGIEKVQISLGVVFIAIFLITILIQIASSFLGIAVTWSEDIAKNSFIWAVFMGAAWGVSRNEHFAFTSINDKLTGKKKIIHQMFIHLISLGFTILMIRYGLEATIKFWNYKWVYIPDFKMGYVWLSLPVTGVTMSTYLITHILEGFFKLREVGE